MSFLRLALFFTLLICYQAHALEPLDVEGLTDHQPLTLEGKLEYAPESDCRNKVLHALPSCSNLALLNEAVVSLGFTQQPYWFFFSLTHSGSSLKTVYVELAYPLLDDVQLKISHNGELIEAIQTGDELPFGDRPFNNANFIFPVTLAPNQTLDFAVRVETGSSLQLPLYVWTPEQFSVSQSKSNLLIGMVIGGMLFMCIYTLLLFASTKDKSYVYFSFTLLAFSFIQSGLSGLSYPFLWPNSPNWNEYNLVIVTNLALIGQALFSYSFLNLSSKSVVTKNILRLTIALSSIIMVLCFWVEYRQLIGATLILLVFVPLTGYIKSIQLWRSGYIPARYFVLAYSLFVISLAVFVVSKFGLIERSFFTEYSIYFGAVGVVTLLSLALADQLNQQKRERTRAQLDAIDSLQQFENLYNHSSEGIFRLDLKGRLLSANPAFMEAFSAQDVTHFNSRFATLSEACLEQELRFDESTLSQTKEFNEDIQFNDLTGKMFWVALNMRLVEDHKAAQTVIEGSLVNISERKDSEQKLKYLANYDQLTGLINRNAFQQRLNRLVDQAHQYDQKHCLLYIDLDRFKLVNDTCGHIAGDELLKQLSLIFSFKVRQRDATARIGGDEFAILLENCELTAAVRIGDELQRELSKYRFDWQGKHFDVGASIGIVAINKYSESAVNLLNLADSVCLMAKEQGRNRVIVHDENAQAVNQKIQAKNMLATIHEAIESNNFALFRQKIVSLSQPSHQAYEVLIRLNLAGEIVGPGVFIPAAERYNVMAKIDRWVVCAFVDYLTNNLHERDALEMATVNLSGQTLSDPDFLPFLVNLLEQRPEVSNKLCFELTESAALNNLSESSELVMKMKSLGVKFAVDDFGSGYASYNYLTQLPIDFVKIDGSFSLNIHNDKINQAVVRSITEISHTMGIKVIAEFVESEEILNCLTELGVDMVQGYYLGKPEPV